MDTVLSYSHREMDDVVTPNFRRLIKDGFIINNPCSYSHVVESATIGSYAAYYTSNGALVYQSGGSGSVARFYEATFGPNLPSLEDMVDELVATAKSMALSRIDKSPYAFLEDVFELRETIRFIRDPLESLRTLSESFKKARLKRERYLLKKFKRNYKSYWRQFAREPRLQAYADVWLSYRFAFSPLVRSAHQLVEAVQTKLRRPERRTARGFSRGADDKSGNSIHTPFTWFVQNSVDYEVRASVIYSVSNPSVDFFYKYGLRLKDLPENIWAILPYSFMVDRILNLSNTFGGLVNLADPRVTIEGASVSVRANKTWKKELLSQNSSGYDVHISDASVSNVTFEYDRSVWEPTWSDTLARVNLRGLVRDAKSIADLLTLVYKNVK
jgi:hypothetical protein